MSIFENVLNKDEGMQRFLNQFQDFRFEDFLEKGKRAQIGEVRDWGGIKFQKTESGWVAVKKSNKNQQNDEQSPSQDVYKLSKASKEYIDLIRSQKDWFTKISNEVLNSVQNEIGENRYLAVTPTDLKKDHRISEKFFEDEGIEKIQDIKDLMRNTFVCQDDSDIEKTIEIISKRFNISRIKRQKLEDFDGYSGNIINIKLPKGGTAEIQVNTPEMIFGKEIPESAKGILGEEVYNKLVEKAQNENTEYGKGHLLYEIIRNKKSNPQERMKAKEYSRKYYDSIRKFKIF